MDTDIFRSARAQNRIFVLVVVLVLRSDYDSVASENQPLVVTYSLARVAPCISTMPLYVGSTWFGALKLLEQISLTGSSAHSRHSNLANLNLTMEKCELVIVTWKSVDPRKDYTLYHYI